MIGLAWMRYTHYSSSQLHEEIFLFVARNLHTKGRIFSEPPYFEPGFHLPETHLWSKLPVDASYYMKVMGGI